MIIDWLTQPAGLTDPIILLDLAFETKLRGEGCDLGRIPFHDLPEAIDPELVQAAGDHGGNSIDLR